MVVTQHDLIICPSTFLVSAGHSMMTWKQRRLAGYPPMTVHQRRVLFYVRRLMIDEGRMIAGVWVYRRANARYRVGDFPPVPDAMGEIPF